MSSVSWALVVLDQRWQIMGMCVIHCLSWENLYVGIEFCKEELPSLYSSTKASQGYFLFILQMVPFFG